MTTYERGKEPQGAPVVYHVDSYNYVIRDVVTCGARITLTLDKDHHEISEIEDTCRAFHANDLARNYAQAKHALDAAATSADMESVRAAYYDAARALCEAVR